MLCRTILALVGMSLVFHLDAISAEITAQRSERGAVVKIDGRLFAEYLVRSGTKPILWPIIGPTAKPMTRDFPMHDRPGEAKDHPHQRSLWFSHGSVNGIDFWAEQGKVGTIKHLEFAKIASGKPAVVATRNAWLAADGRRVCEDQRTLRFDTDGDARWIDFDITLKATDGDVVFGDTKEGTFGVRVAQTLSVDARRGGKIVNSRGQTNAAAWGRPDAWVDYHGPIDGETVGIAILNHPDSFRYPTHWHVRTYGLFAANPFGLHDFPGGKKADGTFTLRRGDSVTFRYRVLLHRGDEREGKVAERFSAYSKGPAHSKESNDGK
ncbi:MAG: PmoA family protein [Thermoguttaceae bacterium]